LPPPFTRQTFTEDLITTRTPAAHEAVKKEWLTLRKAGEFDPPSTGGTASKIIKDLADLDGFEEADGEFLAAELKGTIASEAELRQRLEPLADRPWDEESPVERSILLIGAWEITHQKDIPFRVTINEAIELGKRFSTQNSGAFINGILDKIKDRARPAAPARPGEAAAES
jgi:N utilization substance protein B